jgi:GAF domain-containing protein
VLTGQAQIIQNTAADPALITTTLCQPGFNWLAVTPLIARGAVLGTLFITSRSRPALSSRSVELLAAIGNQIGLSLENARFMTAERRRAEQLQLINEVGRHFTSILDIDQVLVQVVQLIQQTFGYYHVAIGLVEGDEVVYRMGAGSLWDEPDFDFQPARLKVGQEGLAGFVAGSGRPLRVPDVSQESRYVWMQGSQTRSELAVPIRVKEQVIGVLDLQSDHFNHFGETDQAIMEALASQAGIAIENARLYEQAQQLAVFEERNRLARDLHDSVTQSIYSLTLLAEAGQRMIQAGDTEQIVQNQSRLGAIAQQALQEMRLLVYELRPLDLKKAGIVAALEQRLEVVERRAGVEAHLVVSGEIQLTETVEEALYRIAHEA